MQPKGVFNDNLEVFGPADREIPILTYPEYLQITARMLRLLLCLAYGISSDVPGFPRGAATTLEQDPLYIEHRALCEIIRRAQTNRHVKISKGVSPVSAEADDVAKLLENLPITNEGRRVFLRMAAALVRKLSLHYALVAAITIPTDRRLLVIYRRTLIPELELRSDGEDGKPGRSEKVDSRIKGWLRVLFGTRPVNVTVSLDNSWTCQSYHVQVEAPAGLYLAQQRLIASEKYLATKAEGAPTPPHYRFRRRLGQSYAHFYGRYFPVPLPDERRPKIQVGFYETPPGSLFRAAIASCASLALVWLVGFVLSRNSDPSTDAPAYLLVFPGIAASWLGFDTTSRQLFDGSLAAKLSLAATTFISLAASGAFILSKSHFPLFAWNIPDSVSVLGVYSWPWAMLVTIAFGNTFYVSSRWLCASWHFKHLADRPDPDQVA